MVSQHMLGLDMHKMYQDLPFSRGRKVKNSIKYVVDTKGRRGDPSKTRQDVAFKA